MTQEEHDHWLLIFDNADDLTLAEEYLPANENGHLLLTTRRQSPGKLTDSIDIDTMDKDEGTLLILRRAKLLATDAPLAHAKPEDRTQAERIVAVMDGLPLALDQAAAYIEETRCALTAFLDAYQDARADLLRRRGRTSKDHPLPVATTWKLSFERVQQANPSAADLLHVCAFLAPDAIPEDMLIAGTSELGPHLAALKDHTIQWNEAIAQIRYLPTFLLPRVAVKHEQYQRCIFSLGRAGRKVPLSLMNTKWLSCMLIIMSSLPPPLTSLNVRVTGARSCPSPINVGPMNILAFVPSPPGNSMIST